jgi:hypothetical protein
VKVIGHQAIAVEQNRAFSGIFAKQCKEEEAIGITEEYRLTINATLYNVLRHTR